MFACFFILLLLSPVIIATVTIENLCTPDELTEMGVRLGHSHI